MSPLEHNLARINGQINRWRAFEYALAGAAGIALSWAALALADMLIRPRAAGRVALSVLFAAAVAAALAFVLRVLQRRRPPAAVAALLERQFPQLDNHLINRVLFASDAAGASPWLRAYLNDAVPGWSQLPLAELKNRHRRRIGAGALAAALLLLTAPALPYGRAWTVALQRVANPFSTLTPPTFASVLAVAPGEADVPQGGAVELSVRARGRAGQSVTLELIPADDARTVYRLGAFDATGVEQTFIHRIPKLVAPASYRFTVGDAWPTERYTLTPVPPLAVEALTLDVVPPAYTRLPRATYPALDASPEIPAQAGVTVSLTLNRAAASAMLAIDDGAPLPLDAAAQGRTWRGVVTNASGTAWRLTAEDGAGGRLTQTIRCVLVPDRPPSIRVTAPAGRAELPPGSTPVITFEVGDDYGLEGVWLEKIRRGAKPDDPGERLAQWSADGETGFNGQWNGTLADLSEAGAFRLVAFDRREPGPGGRTVSPPIVFVQTQATEQYKAQLVQKGEAQKSLGQLVTRQRDNLRETAALTSSLPMFDSRAWETPLTRQREIRTYAEALLQASASALGGARVVVAKTLEPMADAIAQLGRLQAAAPDGRPGAAAAALDTQKLILRLLTLAQNEARSGDRAQSSSGLLAMVDALLKGQTAVRAATESAVQRGDGVSDGTIERQSALPLDLAELIELARRDAGMAKEDDPLRALMAAVADTAENLKIKADMLRAAQALQNAVPDRALGPQANATNSLQTLKRLLVDWKADETGKQTEQALETIHDAREAVKKLEQLQKGLVDALRATETQGNKTIEEDEELVEEIAELKALMAEAMLKVATDLQSLPELDAANELVTDCYQIYEAMAQVAGTEKQKEATELGLQKEDYYLEMMAETGEKLDEMEHWLANKPDDIKRNIEAFDQAEIQSAIPKVGMPEELQDLIGDLLEEQEELAEKTDDSLTNQGAANPALGWEIAEGETVSYSAGGKTGNRRPDHKEQDGRSQVGRAGMADGEVMAKSGKINAGDEQIDKRRTKDSSQSGYVEEEGHAEAKATGGGKNSGYSDEKGMAGTEADVRRQAKAQQIGEQARQAGLARVADAVYAKAQLNGLRIPPGFNSARENMSRAAEAGRAGMITQMREFQNRAIQDLLQAQASLDAGLAGATMGAGVDAGRAADAAVASSPDEAPAEFRELVSDYFKAIGELK